MSEFKDLVKEDLVFIKDEEMQKEEIIRFLCEKVCEYYGINKKEDIIQNILKREKSRSSGIGAGLAFPHARMLDLDEVKIAVLINKKPIDFKSLDGKPTHIVFFFLSPLRKGEYHLRFLHFITNFANKNVFNKVLSINSPKEFIDIWNSIKS